MRELEKTLIGLWLWTRSTKTLCIEKRYQSWQSIIQIKPLELLDQVIDIDAKYKQAYNARGQALEAQGKYEAAIAAYDRALKIDPKWTLALMNKMHAMLATGRQKEAVDILLRT